MKPEQVIYLKDVDIKNYAKHIIKDGDINDKRELLANLKSKLVLTNKILKLEK